MTAAAAEIREAAEAMRQTAERGTTVRVRSDSMDYSIDAEGPGELAGL